VGGIAGDPIEDVVGGPQVTVRVSADATVVATGSGVLPADITAIAAAVWDTVLASHLTAGSTGKALDDASAGGGGGGATPADIWTYATRTLTASSDPTASDIATAVLNAAQTTPIQSDVRKMNNAAVTGTGIPTDLWRGIP
jgi:hypothetical protein